MMKMVILANKYPNRTDPNVCVFIQQRARAIADEGNECIIIAPVPINRNLQSLTIPYRNLEKTENGSVMQVFHPKYLSAGQKGRFFQKVRILFTTKMYEIAVESVLKKEEIKPDVVHSCFLCPAGVVASRLGLKYHLPTFMEHGEAVYSGDYKYGNARLKKELRGLSGVIAVSKQNKDFVVNAGIVDKKIVTILPNGYREERFFPRQKAEARKRFGFPVGAFIVGMCGSFDKRKGVMRLQNAVEQIPNVYFACAGKGKLVPGGDRCLWAKPVNNEELSWFYSALDVFVLPTTNEGCCNAIIEAMACGCPIISSDRSFNDEICDTTNSILVDPMDIEAIRDAIIELKEHDGKRMQLAQGSIEKSKELRISERAKRIIEFMESKF